MHIRGCKCGSEALHTTVLIVTDGVEIDCGTEDLYMCAECFRKEGMFCDLHGPCILIDDKELYEEIYEVSNCDDARIPFCVHCIEEGMEELGQEKIARYSKLIVEEACDSNCADDFIIWSTTFLSPWLTNAEQIIGGIFFCASLFGLTIEQGVSKAIIGEDNLIM